MVSVPSDRRWLCPVTMRVRWPAGIGVNEAAMTALEARGSGDGRVNVARVVDGSRSGRADATRAASVADKEAEEACARLEQLTEVLVSNHTTIDGDDTASAASAAHSTGGRSDEAEHWADAAEETSNLEDYWFDTMQRWADGDMGWFGVDGGSVSGDSDGTPRGGSGSSGGSGDSDASGDDETERDVPVHRQFSALIASAQQERLHTELLARLRNRQVLEPRVETVGQRVALRCGSTLKKDWDREFLACAFPFLFPFGVGFHSARHVRVSFKRYLGHLLRMHTSNAEDCPLFVLTAFGIVARGEVSKSAYLRAVSSAPGTGVQLRGITPAVFEAVASHMERQDDCRRRHVARPPVPAEVEAAGAWRAATCSVLSPRVRPNELVLVAQRTSCENWSESARRGGTLTGQQQDACPSWLQCPATSGYRRCSLPLHQVRAVAGSCSCGHMTPTLPADYNCCKALLLKVGLLGRPEDDGDTDAVPPFTLRVARIGQSAGSAAFYFSLAWEACMRHLVGIDVNTGTPIEGAGVFGRVVCVWSSTEPQERLHLHAHMLLWVPRVSRLLADVLAGKRGAHDALQEYIDSITCAEVVPWRDVPCVKGTPQHAAEELVQLPLHPVLGVSTKDGHADPAVLRCLACKENVGARAATLAALRHQWQRLGGGLIQQRGELQAMAQFPFDSADASAEFRVHAVMHDPAGCNDAQKERVVLNRAVLAVMTNWHRHSFTCFKKSSRCRYVPTPVGACTAPCSDVNPPRSRSLTRHLRRSTGSSILMRTQGAPLWK